MKLNQRNTVVVAIMLSISALVHCQSLMRQLWMTPIQIFSLAEEGSPNVPHQGPPQTRVEVSGPLDDTSKLSRFNPQLFSDVSSLLLRQFHNFRRNEKLILYYRNKLQLTSSEASVSDVYYFFQRDLHASISNQLPSPAPSSPTTEAQKETQYLLESGLLTPKQHQDAISTIKYINKLFHPNIIAAVGSYFSENFIQQDLARSTFPFIWTSFHRNGTSHQAHHHYGSIMSGVFYLAVPEGAGSLIFEDPRGALPPFGNTFVLKPSVGDLILFPSWLVHRVTASLCTDYRISMSFNIDGKWESTSDINHGYIVE